VGAVTLALAAGTLAACGSSASSTTSSAKLSGQTLTVYTQAPYGTQLKDYQEYYAYIANAFHKATGSKISWVYSSNAVSLSQELEQAAATSSGPDVWSIGSSFNGTASALNEFYTIKPGDWSSFGGQSSFVPKMLTMSDVASYYKNLPLALAFIQASTSPAAQLEQFKIMGWMPVTAAGVKEVETAYPATIPFIDAEQNSLPTDYTPAWSYIETGVLAVIGHEAQQLAGGHPYSSSYVLSQLQAENAVVQSHLGGS
jgi:hypothetical protein